MTGLNIKKDQILEFACVLTDGQLTQQILGPCMVIHADQTALENMDDWCKKYNDN
jgi:oligoribonuclease